MGAGLLAVLALLAYIAQRAERRTSAFSDELKPISLDAYRREPRAQSSATDFSALDVAWGQAYQSNQHRSRQKPTEWSLEVLRSIEWKRFEELCAALFREQGSRAETQVCGPDGGIDIHVYGSDPVSPLTIVQCKAWNNQQIGVNLIRELLGVMTHTKVGHGMFMTTSTFSEDAVAFAQANNIALLSGQAVLKEIVELPADAQARLLSVATEGDYMTPTCASCGIKMVWRDKGQFWGCVNYPRCSSRLFSKAV
jgi:restriction system protein